MARNDQLLQAASVVCQEEFSLESQADAASLSSSLTPAMSTEEFLRVHPAGASTGDPELDKAVSVVRLLYTTSMRDMQTHVNETLTEFQAFTADPKTDAAKGKVGR